MFRRAFPLLAICLSVLFSGCGNDPGTVNGFSGTTSVTLLGSATADDKLTAFAVGLTGLTLTNKNGTQSTLLVKPIGDDFLHLNDSPEPLVTVTVPQGVYTSATATVSGGSFTCLALTPTGGLDTSTFNSTVIAANQVTVNLPAPLTITGSGMLLTLDLQAAKSATYQECYSATGSVIPFAVTPTFSLVASPLSASPTSYTDGRIKGIQGLASATEANGFTLTPAYSPALAVNVNSTTSFQGAMNLSAIKAGMAVSIDGNLQTDGSLTSTRVMVLDPVVDNLSMYAGPLISVNSHGPFLEQTPVLQQGPLGSFLGYLPLSESPSTVFQISGEQTNLASLPFAATFTPANLVAGQNVTLTSHAKSVQSYPLYITTSTVMLTPQTVNATVSTVSSVGGFKVYTVTLAPYALFPLLAQQQDQATQLTSSSTLTVYADSNTQHFNTAAEVVGAQLRFRGLIFNDNGNLRMDAESLADGITP